MFSPRAWMVLPLALLLSACTTAPTGPAPAAFARQQQTLHVGEYDVRYVRRGSGPPVVLLHGGGTWSYSWRRNIDALATRHEVIAIDMIGHGYTRRHTSGRPAYDLVETSRLIAGVMDGLQIDRADFIGNSWGGGWALAFAQTHPDRVGRLVLIGSSGVPSPDRPEWALLRWPVVGDVFSRFVSREMVADGLKEAVYDPATVTGPDIDAAFGPLTDAQVQAAQVGFMRKLDFRITAAGLPTMRQPTLIIWGEADHYVTRRSQEQICTQAPQARLVVLGYAGHVAHEDRPDTVDQLALDFLDGPPPPGKPLGTCPTTVTP